MANTVFFRNVEKDSDSITWKEIFSEFNRKHTRSEMDYALSAGTALNQVSEGDMLSKWQKPWLFWRAFLGGGALVILIYLLYFINTGFALFEMITCIIPSLWMPVVLMILIWELNIPKNISIYQLMLFFLIGGLLSITFALVMNSADMSLSLPYPFESSAAAFVEEPAKLLAAVLILAFLLSRNVRIYGLTGLVIGAAVGAGFSGFESAQYAYNYGIVVQLLRIVLALGGHTVFCAPYIGALALAMKENKLSLKCFLDRDFLLTFVLSIAAHFFWNMELSSDLMVYLKCALITVLLWMELLYVVRKCLQQAVRAGKHGRSGAAGLCIAGIFGALKGNIWTFTDGKSLHLGRDSGNDFCFPADVGGISRRHCTIRLTSRGVSVRDDGSTYGTYVNNLNTRLIAGEERILQAGDIIYLGSTQQAFQVVQTKR